MKRKLLLLTALVVSALTGMRAQTWTASNLSEDGWTKISSISKDEIANNYYIFLSEDESLILRLEQSTSQASYAAFYRSLSNPALDGFEVWTLEANGDNYAMRNLEWNSRQMQTEWSGSSNDLRWRTNDQMNSISWTGLGLTLADGSWTLSSTQYNRPLGIYNNTTGTPADGNEVGANDSDKGQKFQIYAISRTDYWELAAAEASAQNPVDFTGFIKNAEIYNNNKGVIPFGWSEDASIRQAGNTNRTAGTNITELEGWSGGVLKVKYYQSLTGLPIGKYMLKATGGDSNGTGGGKIFINGGNEDVSAVLEKTSGEVSTESVLTADGNLTIGLTADGNDSWVHANNFKLYYLGIDLSDYITAYQTALTNAKTAAATTDKIAPSVLTSLNSAIETYDEGKVSETKDELETATSSLIEVTNKANKSIASYKIIEAGTIPDNKLDGWVCENTNTFHINTWSVEGNPGNDPSGMVTPFIENWVGKGSYLGAGKVYYTLEGLEPGEVYYASALVRSYNEKDATAPNGPNFFINNVVTDLASDGETFTYNNMSGIYATLGGAATVGEDGKLSLGVVINNNVNYNWVAFKNVSIRSMDDAFNAAVEKVTSLNGTVPVAVYNNAYAVVETYSDDNYPTTAEGFETAIAGIEAAATTASAFVEPYAAWTSAKENAQNSTYEYLKNQANSLATEVEAATAVATVTEKTAQLNSLIEDFNLYDELLSYAKKLQAAENDNAEANVVLNAAISTAESSISTAQSSDAVKNVVSTLKAAMETYANAANPINDAKFDLTFMLTNPDVSAFANGTRPEGWFTDQQGGNFQVMTNNAMNADGKPFMEYWSENARANGTFNLYQKVTLSEGTYKMSGLLGAQQTKTAEETPTSGIYFAANDVLGTQIPSGAMSEASIEFVQSAQGEVKIGMKAMTGNNLRWTAINDIKLFKVPAKSYEISENEDYEITQAGAGDVKLTRTISATNINTLVLPFSLTQEELETAFGEGSKAYVVDSFDAEKENITLTEKAGITPNEPVLLQATQDGSSYEFAGRTIVAAASATPTTTTAGIVFVGVYTYGYDVPQGSYIIKSNKFYCVDSASKLKSTRAYFTLPSDVSGVKALTFTLNGEEATGIFKIADDELKMVSGTIYDLSGRAVKNPSRGLYIINGKKVFVK